MRKLMQWYRLAAVAAAIGTLGCKSLEVANPNAPDAARAFSDPGAVAGLVTGAMRNWFNTRGTYYGAETLDMMADNYSSSWNNMNNRYYSSYGPVGTFQANCPQRCGWVNNTSDPKRLWVEGLWYGYYGMLSSVNDVLTAIRKNHLDLGGDEATNQAEAASVLLQGVVFAGIALNYDKGFVVTDNTDISNPTTIPFRPRAEMRDSAVAFLQHAIDLLAAHPFAKAPSTWFGTVNGIQYSSTQLIQVARTAQAEALAMFARCLTGCPTASDNDAATDWGKVATYAAQGVSSGAGFDFTFFQDGGVLYDWVKGWGNNFGDVRVDSRVVHLITAGPDPSRVHHDPWTAVELSPNATDKRVGDGTFGPTDAYDGPTTFKADAGHGTDYAYTPSFRFNPLRGPAHQSNLTHVRYIACTSSFGNTNRCQNPVYSQQVNDLLWAEGLIKGPGGFAQAATLINKTRVNRGGLPALTGGEGKPALLAALQYELEVEDMGMGDLPFYNRRRETPYNWPAPGTAAISYSVGGPGDPRAAACPSILCLWPGTPRHQPVPAKELSVLVKELYSFGGPIDDDVTGPAASSAAIRSNGEPIFSARQIGAALNKKRPSGVTHQ